jgi:hypothetical protein
VFHDPAAALVVDGRIVAAAEEERFTRRKHGKVPPSRWGPPADRPWHVALWAGRRGDPHGPRPDPGLLEISTLDVLLELRHVRDTYAALPGGSTIGDGKAASCAS